MKSFISSIILFLFILSCAEKDKPYSCYTEFPTEKSLTANKVELDGTRFRYPFRVKIEGDKAILMDIHNMSSYFHLFTYPEYKHVISFGRNGEQPDEMKSAENVRFRDNKIWTLDANRNRLCKFEISGDSVIKQKDITLDEGLLRAVDFAFYDDSTFIIPDYTGEHRICMVNDKGEIIERIGKIPTEKHVKNGALSLLAQAWRSFIDYNPHHGIVVMATQLGEVLEIYNLKDSSVIVKAGPGGEPKFGIYHGQVIPNGIMGFSDVQITDKYIYAVFQGNTFKEIVKERKQFEDGGKFVYVFDLKGNPVCKYELDRYIYGMNVDEERNLITATDVNYVQPIAEFGF